MKVLLISHTVLSKTNNMGKTLLSYLSDFCPGEVTQFYIHSEVPTDNRVCTDYYRFTDIDAIKSIFNPFHKGRTFGEKDIAPDKEFARVDSGLVSSAYGCGEKRRGWSMNAREIIWKMAHWKRKELKEWIESFSPDVVLFASGDYAFMYDIAYWIVERYHKPLVTICVDDYYIHQRNQKTVLGRIHNRILMRSVNRTIQASSCIFTLSDSMNDAYSTLFKKQCFTVHNSVPDRVLVPDINRCHISYIGNLGFGRCDQLISMGEALADLHRESEPTAIDVYTGAYDKALLDKLSRARGIRLHGQIGADEVLKVMQNSIAVIHTESFDREQQDLVRFSVSTKIAESLMYAPCLIAYGPEGIASIDYLKKHKAAYTITDPRDLASGLNEIITNSKSREEIEKNARKLGSENHNSIVNAKKVRSWLQGVIDCYKSGLITGRLE